MRVFSMLLTTGLAGCAYDPPDIGESFGSSTEELNGELSSQGLLTATGDSVTSTDENVRRADTNAYYASARTALGPTGQGFGTIADLTTLQLFRDQFEFDGLLYDETVTYYYNCGDLGLGREMHCIPTVLGETACYVTNYPAGDDFGEFTFGLSSDIEFANMNATPLRVLATVAMVYRADAISTRDKMLSAYDSNGNLADNAPLDRHGISFAVGFAEAGNINDISTKRPRAADKRAWASVEKSPRAVIREAFDEAVRRDPEASPLGRGRRRRTETTARRHRKGAAPKQEVAAVVVQKSLASIGAG
jgi:hypothetical protein